MIHIGITGGIGGGKSTVCGLFSRLGVPVYDSDARARSLMNQDKELRLKIVQLFGPEAYLVGTATGELNRPFVASKIFADSSLRGSLEALVHPCVAADFASWAEQYSSLGGYLLLESAILFESGFNELVDKVITVSAPLETRVERVVSRSSLLPAQARQRIGAQMTDSERETQADFVIHNCGSLSELETQVHKLDQQILNLAHQIVQIGNHSKENQT